MTSRESVVDVNNLDSRFPDRILKERGGEALRACYQCGVCTASCPISSIDAKYSPRRTIKRALLGMKDQVLNDPFIWLCSICFLCQERCPQDVRPPEVMTVLKNVAVKAGLVPPGIAKMVEIYKKNGNLYTIDDFIEDQREELGLPKLKLGLDAVKKILEE